MMDEGMTIVDVGDWARPVAIDGHPHVMLWSILSGRYDVADARQDFYQWLATQAADNIAPAEATP